jgi:hypothetical protein
MRFPLRRPAAWSLATLALFLCSGAARSPAPDLYPPGWPDFAGSSHHWGARRVATQPLLRVKWSTPIDLHPEYLAHYGTPLVTPLNTVVFSVRTTPEGTFHVEGRRASDGAVIWTQPTDYSPPPSGWGIGCGVALTPTAAAAIPDSGGRVLLRNSADAPVSPAASLVFYGAANYAADPSTYNDNVKIHTPITADRDGNLFFGFTVLGPTPINLRSGIARISPKGQGTWIAASTAAGDDSVDRMPNNCAPALGMDSRTLYVPVAGGHSYMLCLDSTTLAPLHRAALHDPWSGADAWLIDYSTASPTIGPDGDVFQGVFEAGVNYNDRGWMLHFNADLSQQLPPGSFGWDNTCSIVPAFSVPSYHGPSTYLLLSKYNNYYGIGSGDGLNRVAVLDPRSTQVDPISGVTVLREVITMLAPTQDPNAPPGSVREWCINNAAVDELGHAGLVNNEDGNLYRWDFNTNTLTQSIPLTGGTSEAYTPTIIGPDGAVYAINGAILFAVGR